jgi:hypothetical protein
MTFPSVTRLSVVDRPDSDHASQGGGFPPAPVVATLIIVVIVIVYLLRWRSAQQAKGDGPATEVEHPPLPRQIEPGIDARQVLARMAAAYGRLSTYRDSGLIIDNSITRPSIERTCGMFATAYRRPDALAFLVQRRDGDVCSIFHWFSIVGDQLTTRSRGTSTSGASLAEVIADSTRQSVGVTGCVLPLLRELPGLRRLDGVSDVVYEETELMWGHMCYKLTGTMGAHRVSLWIDHKRHLLRRADLQDGRFTILFTARPNSRIESDAFTKPRLMGGVSSD